MKKFTPLFAAALALGLLMGACSSDPEPVASQEEPEEPQQEEPRPEFVIFPETGSVPVTGGCVGTDGDFNGDLPDGGLFRLRGSETLGVLIDMLPSGGADPVATQTEADSDVTFDGGYTSGTATLFTLDGGDNSIEIEFQVGWGDETPACPETAEGPSLDGLTNAAFLDDELFEVTSLCYSREPGFDDYYVVISSFSNPDDLLTIHLEIAETNEGDGEFVEITELGIGGPVRDLAIDGAVFSGSATVAPENDDTGAELLFSFDATDPPTCD